MALKSWAATLTLTAVADTSLYEGKPDFNLGGTTLLAGTNQLNSVGRALFRFDLGSLPAAAVVTSVQVLNYCTRQPDPDQHTGPVESDFSLHRMLVSWGEGSGSGATGSVAMVGDATWNNRHTVGISWGAGGSLNGTDFASDSSATTTVGNVGPYAWGSSTELINDAQGWLADPSSNFGFMLMSQDENSPGSGRRFASKEVSSVGAPAARLVITYVPEPSVLGMIAVATCAAGWIRRRPICR